MQDRSHISSNISVMIKTLSESWLPHVGFRDSATVRGPNHTCTAGASESKTSSTGEEHTEDCKVGAEDWPVQNFELSKDSTIANCQIHKTAFKRRHHPMKATRTTSTSEPSLIEPTNLTTCLKQVLQSQRNHGRMDQINRGKVIRNFMGGDIPKICGTHQSTTIRGIRRDAQ